MKSRDVVKTCAYEYLSKGSRELFFFECVPTKFILDQELNHALEVV